MFAEDNDQPDHAQEIKATYSLPQLHQRPSRLNHWSNSCGGTFSTPAKSRLLGVLSTPIVDKMTRRWQEDSLRRIYHFPGTVVPL